MKTILEENTRRALLARIAALTESTPAQCGKMSAFQMLRHCTLWNEMMQGKLPVRPMFLGKLFGKMALRSVLKDDCPLRKGAPTAKELVVAEKDGDFTHQLAAFIRSIQAYQEAPTAGIVHPFFGKMTLEEAGQFVFKHLDHHLRQFGV